MTYYVNMSFNFFLKFLSISSFIHKKIMPLTKLVKMKYWKKKEKKKKDLLMGGYLAALDRMKKKKSLNRIKLKEDSH